MSEVLADQKWDELEAAYIDSGPMHHVMIDDLLTPSMFAELHEGLINEPGWNFNPAQERSLYLPLPQVPRIDEVAKSLQERLPRLMAGFDFVEHWAFSHVGGVGLRPHFDVGSVTVNLWLTPDEHNLTPGRAGLILYSVRQPADLSGGQLKIPGWSDEYFVSQHDGTEVRIPYRCNRAVVFDSKLYHASDEGTFRGGDLWSCRMNLSLLFDDRHIYETRHERFGLA